MGTIDTLILTALLPEARAVARAFLLPASFRQPLAASGDTAVALIGPRAAKLEQVTRGLAPRRVVMAGLAGALSPELSLGDVVIGGGGQGSGKAIYTSQEIVATPAHKADLWRATGCLAVDMETAPAAAYARRVNADFLIVRVISDAASDALDPSLLHLIDSEGHPKVSQAMALILRHPGKLAMLLRTRKAAQIALENLSRQLLILRDAGWKTTSPLSIQRNGQQR